MSLHSPSKCSFTPSKLIRNAWLFLLAARHRMQALSALACCVGCAFSSFASLKISLFIQLLINDGDPFYSWVTILILFFCSLYFQNLRAMLYHSRTMCDKYKCLSGLVFGQSLQHLLFGIFVECRCGFIENHDASRA